MVVDVAVSDRLSAILWRRGKGRGEPTPSEIDLFGLIGLQAGTAIDHALLYAQVRSQADELNRLAAIQSDFLRGVTHDLQTPLTCIRALATELGPIRQVPRRAGPTSSRSPTRRSGCGAWSASCSSPLAWRSAW